MYMIGILCGYAIRSGRHPEGWMKNNCSNCALKWEIQWDDGELFISMCMTSPAKLAVTCQVKLESQRPDPLAVQYPLVTNALTIQLNVVKAITEVVPYHLVFDENHVIRICRPHRLYQAPFLGKVLDKCVYHVCMFVSGRNVYIM